MTKLMQITSSTALLLLLSGCTDLNTNLNTPVKPTINESVEVIDNTSIRSLSDISSIALEWKRVEDPKVIGYNFYRANMHKDGRRLKLIKSINNKYTTHYLDVDLEPNTKYVYQISSKIANNIESNTTDAYVATTLQRIVPVSFVQGLSELPKQIKIVWRPHPDQRISYYRIQKFNSTLNEWIRLRTIKGRLQAEYIDTGLSNNTEYKYRITAYSFNDVPTQTSNVITAKTKPLPKDVTNLTATSNQPNKILLQWEPSTSADLIKYEVHRSIVKSFGYTKIKEVSKDKLSYSDSINNNGKEYYYKVIAVDKDNLKSTDKVTPALGSTLIQPKKPSITLAQIQDNQAIVNWTAGDNRAISYNVYKRTRVNFFEYKTAKFTNIQKLRFEDNNIISGVEYKYSIQANDEFGLMSDKTDEAELILPKQTLQK